MNLIYHSKLFEALRCLDPEEINRFKKFTASPYFNNRTILIDFLDIIISRKYIYKENTTSEEILNNLTGNKKAPARTIHDLCHRLLALLEDFIETEKYRASPFQRKMNLMSAAYKKEMDFLIPGIERDILAIHADNTLRDSSYYFENYTIYAEKDYIFRISGKITDDESLDVKTNSLDLFYLAQKLKDSCEILNRSRILSTDFDLSIFETLVGYLLQRPEYYNAYPAINIYLHIALMLSREEHEIWFSRLIDLIAIHEDVFTTEELRSIYVYAQNYCIFRMNKGDMAYNTRLFDIYKHILATGLVFGDNKNMQWDFKNFVSLGLRLKEYTWTHEILSIFKQQLPEALRHNAYNYNLANYYYETGSYKKATRLLNEVEFTDIYYIMGARTMLMKIYFEVAEETSFYSLAAAFKLYITRNKLISKESAEVHLRFIRFAMRLFKFKTMLPYQIKKNTLGEVHALKDKILQTRNAANADWLLRQAETISPRS